MRIRILHGFYIGSRPGVTDVWRVGEADRDLDDETGGYLLQTFGDKFAAVVEAAIEDVPAPEVDRMLRAPSRRRGK